MDNKNQDEEKTVLLDEDEKTVLLDEDEKTVLLDEDEKTVLLDEDEKKVLLDEDDEKTVLLDEENTGNNISPGNNSFTQDDTSPEADTFTQDDTSPEVDTFTQDDTGPEEITFTMDTQLLSGGTGSGTVVKRCKGCMEKIDGVILNAKTCPLCGFSLGIYDAKDHQLKIGSLLNNRYYVGSVIGEGGFGITYIGYDGKLDRRVAVKEYYPSGMVMRDVTGARGNSVTAYGGKNKEQYEKYLDKFFAEARTLAKLDSINGVVNVSDVFTENDTAYIIMEYVDGKDLKAYAKEKGGKLSVTEALTLLKPVALALKELHSKGILHRDISPDNIMVTKENKVVLIDLGASREMADTGKSMSVLLKPGYAPLEQYNSRDIKQGPYSDLYSFCASFYKIITGQKPPEVVERVANDTIKRPSELGVNIDRNIENALMKGLAVRHEDRFQDMGALIDVFYNNATFAPPKQETESKKPHKNEGDATTDISYKSADEKAAAEGAQVNVKKSKKVPVIIGICAAAGGAAAVLSVLLLAGGGGGNGTGQTGATGDSYVAEVPQNTDKELTNINVSPIEKRAATTDKATILKDTGAISSKGQRDTYDFVTPRSGRYRVELSDMPSGMSVDMAFIDPSGNDVESGTGLTNGQGLTVKYLEPDTSYGISVIQNSGTGSYTLNVGIQKATPDITNLTEIFDSVEYTDQRNLYNFVVPKDGTYRFEMSGLSSGVSTHMLIFDDPGNKISEAQSCVNGNGLTLANVRQGDIYEIQVRQSTGYSEYTLLIGQQKDAVQITNNVYVADSMEFTDQVNVYSFNAEKDGDVSFSLSGMSDSIRADIEVLDASGNELNAVRGQGNGAVVTIPGVVQGSYYIVNVRQNQGLGGYALTVR